LKNGLSEVEEAAERKQREALLDLLLGVLDLDPRSRWTPRQAMHHPFIKGEPFTGPYQPPPDSPAQLCRQHHHQHHHHPAITTCWKTNRHGATATAETETTNAAGCSRSTAHCSCSSNACVMSLSMWKVWLACPLKSWWRSLRTCRCGLQSAIEWHEGQAKAAVVVLVVAASGK